MNHDYQSVLQMIRDGAHPADVERVLTDERTPLTDEQIASLREEMRGSTNGRGES